MPDGKFTSTERRGLLLLLALLVAGICAVTIVRNCGRPEETSITVAAPTATDNSSNARTSAPDTARLETGNERKRKKARQNGRTRTPDGRERSHRDESVIDPPDHLSNSTNHHR